jgi:hypothetical protein
VTFGGEGSRRLIEIERLLEVVPRPTRGDARESGAEQES